MRKLLDLGNRYAKESTWKDFALKKAAVGAAAGVFAVTYVPLMTKVFRIAFRGEK